MSDYDNTNRGALFKNTKREKDTHPEYNGSINVAGIDYYINAWVKDGKSGKFFSLSVKPKDAKPAEARPVAPATEWADEDIPF